MAVGLYIPFSRLGGMIGLQPLPNQYFTWLVGMLLSYAILTQVIKVWFLRKYHSWL
jgi:Mg2+-importing ATPase